jgi:hypothetical protein
MNWKQTHQNREEPRVVRQDLSDTGEVLGTYEAEDGGFVGQRAGREICTQGKICAAARR